MATLYLHIGTPKTGTSAIQEFCRANREQLRKRGIAFPLFAPYPKVRLGRNAHFMTEYLREGSRQASPEGEKWRRYFDEIGELFRDTPSVLLSDEVLWDVTREDGQRKWEEVKREADARGFDVKLVVYLRRQDQYISSGWAQSLKYPGPGQGGMPWPQALQQAVERGKHDYFSRLERIAAVFGRENINARVYERQRFVDGDIIADFLSALGLTMDGEFVRLSEDVNPSLSGNMREIKRIINTLPDLGVEKPPMLAEAAIECSLMDEERAPTSLFTEAELAEFLALCEPSNRQLARAYFGTDEPLFSPPGKLAPRWTPDNDEMYASIVRYFGALVIRQQREIEALKSHFYLRRKLRRLAKSMPGRLRKLFGIKSKK